MFLFVARKEGAVGDGEGECVCEATKKREEGERERGERDRKMTRWGNGGWSFGTLGERGKRGKGSRAMAVRE
jgi:hypothetical protein